VIAAVVIVSNSLYRSVVFADPTREEEDLVNGALTIVTLGNKETCIIHKPSTLLCLGLCENFDCCVTFFPCFVLRAVEVRAVDS